MNKQLEQEFEKQTGRGAYYHKDSGAYCYRYTEWLEEYADWLEQKALTLSCSTPDSLIDNVEALRGKFEGAVKSGAPA